MNMSMCEVPVHPVEFLTEADISSLPELPMTLDTDGTYYCDGESTQETTTGAQLFDVNSISKNTWLDANTGELVDVKGFWTSDYIKVSSGTYCIVPNRGSNRLWLYDADKNPLKNNPVSGEATFTIDADVFLRFCGTIDALQVMLNAGSAPLPWEPYTGNAPSPSPEYPQDIVSVSGILKSTNNSLGGRDKLRESQIVIPELRAIPGTDVRDEMVVYEDGTGKIVRRVLYDDLKDAEWFDWWNKGSYYIEGTFLVHTGKFNDIVHRDNPFKCSHFVRLKDSILSSANTQCQPGQCGGFNIAFRVPTTIASTIGEWKEWIANNNVQVLIKLNTPTEEPLTADQIQGILRTHQYHTEIGFDGLDEHLEPEAELKCRVLGR